MESFQQDKRSNLQLREKTTLSHFRPLQTMNRVLPAHGGVVRMRALLQRKVKETLGRSALENSAKS
jgi:hypothetical protein